MVELNLAKQWDPYRDPLAGKAIQENALRIVPMNSTISQCDQAG
jgi:hypothetical protein